MPYIYLQLFQLVSLIKHASQATDKSLIHRINVLDVSSNYSTFLKTFSTPRTTIKSCYSCSELFHSPSILKISKSCQKIFVEEFSLNKSNQKINGPWIFTQEISRNFQNLLSFRCILDKCFLRNVS